MKAIETQYSGYRFRSRLEARWAIFLDTLGVVWEYEVEGFQLDNGMRYLPDFWLPRERVYLEIKGEQPGGADAEKFWSFSRSLDAAAAPLDDYSTSDDYRSAWMIVGVPGFQNGAPTYRIEQDPQHKFHYRHSYLQMCQVCRHLIHALDTAILGPVGSRTCGQYCDWCDCRERNTAGNERFEFHKGDIFLRPGFGQFDFSCPPEMRAAYDAARAARFEHGESGARRRGKR